MERRILGLALRLTRLARRIGAWIKPRPGLRIRLLAAGGTIKISEQKEHEQD